MSSPIDDREMRDLLIRLDQKVTDGFAKFDALQARADNHEQRINALENVFAQMRGGFKVAGWVWGVGGAVLAWGATQILHLTT